MARGRKPHIDPPVVFRTTIPQSLYNQVELAMLDPLSNRARYGGKSDLISALLQEWLEKIKTGKENADGRNRTDRVPGEPSGD